ncbi:hypothetical protein BU23DRAFT_603768 [Bimuria novae-zelandiae CBS 107.79]|uniref:Rhodopsin domain-containing protein n=1 Tax=Bimuria novae-zelandiae CBS 107.79 TaxID=1447943 RepID=A0A6A5UT37_9PLEO|nr:hypothetical protein BU23DRAFT_603768 [Bimuria novae-zelandiae CBS 107.79]
MSGFADLYAHPPDHNDPIPASNRPAAIYGATLPFHILTWAAVAFRLYTRYRVVREPGWDDYLIIGGAIFNLMSLITFYICVHFGLGKHIFNIQPNHFITMFKLLYVQTASYYTCAGLVKLSLLCQYLRLFKKGALRYICIGLLVLTSLWSFLWFLQGWFPCFPVSGFWNRLSQPPPKCWGTSIADMKLSKAAFVGFAASNMTLDTIIFFIPVTLYLNPGIATKQAVALITLFLLGSIVLLMSILRLWTAVRNDRGGASTMDFTWWYPLTMIMAALEIDFAIICASIPIFWPVIVASLPQIFVTQEVRVTHHERLPDGAHMEYELGRTYSVKSNGGDSQENLTKIEGHAKTDYTDQLVVDHVTGKIKSNTEVVGYQKKKKKR